MNFGGQILREILISLFSICLVAALAVGAPSDVETSLESVLHEIEAPHATHAAELEVAKKNLADALKVKTKAEAAKREAERKARAEAKLKAAEEKKAKEEAERKARAEAEARAAEEKKAEAAKREEERKAAADEEAKAIADEKALLESRAQTLSKKYAAEYAAAVKSFNAAGTKVLEANRAVAAARAKYNKVRRNKASTNTHKDAARAGIVFAENQLHSAENDYNKARRAIAEVQDAISRIEKDVRKEYADELRAQGRKPLTYSIGFL